jgi:hypothetical protein
MPLVDVHLTKGGISAGQKKTDGKYQLQPKEKVFAT